MILIRREIEAIEKGQSDREDNLLKNAPHAPELLMQQNWSHPYSKQDAYYPMAILRQDKYWPPVGRISNLYGDKNLFCRCPPMEDYF